MEFSGLKALKDFRFYEILVNAFVVILLISNLVAQKLCKIGPFTLSGAQLLFPDHLHLRRRLHGSVRLRRFAPRDMDRFGSSGLLALMGIITVALPPHPDWHNQDAFALVFGFVPRIVVASLIAYWCGEFANSFVMAKMKLLTAGKYLWMRTIGSTVVGQGVDTVIVIVLAFAGHRHGSHDGQSDHVRLRGKSSLRSPNDPSDLRRSKFPKAPRRRRRLRPPHKFQPLQSRRLAIKPTKEARKPPKKQKLQIVGQPILAAAAFQAASCARPPILLSRLHQPGLHRINFNVSPNPLKLRIGPDQMIVTLILPEGSSLPAQNLVSATPGESLYWPQPSSRHHLRCHQQMHMIRHHDKRM